MKKILITGGAGFIGSHLCDALCSNENKVFVLDNFSTGSLKNMAHLPVELIEQDVCDPINLNELDEIYHLASPASPQMYQRDPLFTLKTNFLGSLRALELAEKTGAKILLSSTSEVYGDPLVHPQPETYYGNVSTVGPRSCYDEGKRVAETLFMDFHRSKKVDIRIARIFNTYGPRMQNDDGRVVNQFLDQALSGQPITIYGDGSQTRSLCYVDDMVQGLMSLMNHPQLKGPVNLGSTEEISILALAQLMLEKTQSKSTLIFEKLPQDDPTQRRPDITLAQSLLGWDPKIDLSRGLDLLIEIKKTQSIKKKDHGSIIGIEGDFKLT